MEYQEGPYDVLINWYESLHRSFKQDGYNDFLQGQLTMLTAVLKQVLTAKEYEKLTRYKPTTKKELRRARNTTLL